MRLVFAAATDVGRMRKNNEDSYLSSKPVAAVADGMGGHSAGEVASAIAIEELAALRDRGPWENETAATDDLKQAILRANRRIRETAARDRKLNGMGTTLVALLEDGDMVHVANVGDSRGYLLRQGELSQVTVDHSLVQELVDDGRLSPEDAERHPQRSVITRALGIDPEVEFDLFTYKLQVGDRLLLCSYGLSDVVWTTQIRNVLLRLRRPQKAARQLVTVANEQVGPDNITVLVVDAVDESALPEVEDDQTGDLTAGAATGAMPLVEGDGAPARWGGRAARAAKDRSLTMHRRLQRVQVAGIDVLVAAAQLPGQPLLGGVRRRLGGGVPGRPRQRGRAAVLAPGRAQPGHPGPGAARVRGPPGRRGPGRRPGGRPQHRPLRPAGVQPGRLHRPGPGRPRGHPDDGRDDHQHPSRRRLRRGVPP